MGRLKLSSFAASSPACSAGITQHCLRQSFLPPQMSDVYHLSWTLTSNPYVAFVVCFLCLRVVSTKHPCKFWNQHATKATVWRHLLLKCLIYFTINMPSAASDIIKTSCKQNASLKGECARWFIILEIMRGKAVGTRCLMVQTACSSILRRWTFMNIIREWKGNGRWLKGGKVMFL